jgi:hypothetical protein
MNLTIRLDIGPAHDQLSLQASRRHQSGQEAAMAAEQDQTIKATLSATSADFPGFASFATANVVLEPSSKNAAIVKVTNLKLPDLEDPGNAVMQAFLQVGTDPGTPDQFALSVVELAPPSSAASPDLKLRFRITRLDSGGGWRRQLRVQILVVVGSKD